MRIAIASDHNGNAARAYVIKVLTRLGHGVCDLGAYEDEGKVDYPDKAFAVAELVCSGAADFGILICGTGTGMAIAANKHPAIRAGIATDRATAELMREHNDANILVLGQWRNSLSEMDEMVQAFLSTPFGGGRHVKRIEMISKFEELLNYCPSCEGGES